MVSTSIRPFERTERCAAFGRCEVKLFGSKSYNGRNRSIACSMCYAEAEPEETRNEPRPNGTEQNTTRGTEHGTEHGTQYGTGNGTKKVRNGERNGERNSANGTENGTERTKGTVHGSEPQLHSIVCAPFRVPCSVFRSPSLRSMHRSGVTVRV
jgi:hypothetical protein